MVMKVETLMDGLLNPHDLSFVTCGRDHWFRVGGQYDYPMLVKFKQIPHCVGAIVAEPSPSSTKASLEFICGGAGLYRGIEWTKTIVPTGEARKEPKRRRKRCTKK